MEWKAGNQNSVVMQRNDEWENVNVFRLRTEDLIEHSCTVLTTNVYVSLELGEFGLEIIVEKDIWIKRSLDRYSKPIDAEPIAEDLNGNILTRVRVFTKGWFFKPPNVLRDTPRGVDKYEVMTWIQLLRTATGNEATDAARQLFWLLEIKPAYWDETHWIRKVLPKFWERWNEILTQQDLKKVREVMST